MNSAVAVVIGVGDGTGAAIVRRFASGGYRVAMLARNRDRLSALERELPACRSFPCDVSDLEALGATLKAIERDLGEASVVVYNAVRATFGRYTDNAAEDFERNFRVNCAGLLKVAQVLAPGMESRRAGAIVVTGNTAAYRGIPSYTLFAPTKAAQRVLAEALARDLGPKGVHVAYVAVDAVIDATWSKQLPVQGLATEPIDRVTDPKTEEYFALPADIAEEVFHVAHQPKSTWAFDVVVRPFGEKW